MGNRGICSNIIINRGIDESVQIIPILPKMFPEGIMNEKYTSTFLWMMHNGKTILDNHKPFKFSSVHNRYVTMIKEKENIEIQFCVCL